MNEKKSVRSCTETIDGIGGIKKILNDEILLTQIICNENKQILLVFSDIINHAIRLNELDKEDFGLLRSKNFITLIINKYYDNPELLLKTVKYIGFIDADDLVTARDLQQFAADDRRRDSADSAVYFIEDHRRYVIVIADYLLEGQHDAGHLAA